MPYILYQQTANFVAWCSRILTRGDHVGKMDETCMQFNTTCGVPMNKWLDMVTATTSPSHCYDEHTSRSGGGRRLTEPNVG